jgi:hypothetical protein
MNISNYRHVVIIESPNKYFISTWHYLAQSYQDDPKSIGLIAADIW